MIAFTIGLLLVSLVSGLPTPVAEADPEPLPVANPEPLPEADPEADPHYGIGPGYGLGGLGGLGIGGIGYPYGGVIQEVLPPIVVEGCVEEIVVGPEYPGIHALLG